jgi:hypothetical protein
MSEPEKKPENSRQRTVRLLKILDANSDNFSVFAIENNPPADLLTLNDLLTAGFISAIMLPNASGLQSNTSFPSSASLPPPSDFKIEYTTNIIGYSMDSNGAIILTNNAK